MDVATELLMERKICFATATGGGGTTVQQEWPKMKQSVVPKGGRTPS